MLKEAAGVQVSPRTERRSFYFFTKDSNNKKQRSTPEFLQK